MQYITAVFAKRACPNRSAQTSFLHPEAPELCKYWMSPSPVGCVVLASAGTVSMPAARCCHVSHQSVFRACCVAAHHAPQRRLRVALLKWGGASDLRKIFMCYHIPAGHQISGCCHTQHPPPSLQEAETAPYSAGRWRSPLSPRLDAPEKEKK